MAPSTELRAWYSLSLRKIRARDKNERREKVLGGGHSQGAEAAKRQREGRRGPAWAAVRVYLEMSQLVRARVNEEQCGQQRLAGEAGVQGTLCSAGGGSS